MLTPPSAQCRSLRRGPRLPFPNCRQRGTLGDLTSFLSKNNGRAFDGTRGKGREEDAGQWDLTEKESHQAHALTPPELSEPAGGTCPAIMSQRTSAIDVPGEGNEPPAVPTGTLLD